MAHCEKSRQAHMRDIHIACVVDVCTLVMIVMHVHEMSRWHDDDNDDVNGDDDDDDDADHEDDDDDNDEYDEL